MNKNKKNKLLSISIILSIIFSFSLVLINFFGNKEARAEITTGLVGHWNFDEGAGTTASDSSGNGNTGTLTNGPVWTTGKINGALNFDGVDDNVSIPWNSSLDLPNNGGVISVWFKLDSANLGQGSRRSIFR